MVAISKTRAQTILREIITEHPRRKNPSDVNDQGVYHQVKGSTVRRCLIGEMMHRIGVDVTDLPVMGLYLLSTGTYYNVTGNANSGPLKGTSMQVISYLENVQSVADTQLLWGNKNVRQAVEA